MKKKTISKRELIAPRGDKRYIRRDEGGRIKESDDVSHSLSQDRRRMAKTVAKPGQGDRGDRKPVSPKRKAILMPSASSAGQDLFGDNLPEGFHYQNDLITSAEEHQLIDEIEHLPFRAFEFHGFTGKRRVVSFGWRYDFNGGGLTKTEDMPEFLLSIRGKAARFANIQSEALQQVLVTEYAPGAAIGWHKDRAVFGDVVGVSLVSPCTFRLRCKVGTRWDRRNLTAEPRSVYLLRGPSRNEWEHSIPAVDQLRYSLTFRNIRENGA